MAKQVTEVFVNSQTEDVVIDHGVRYIKDDKNPREYVYVDPEKTIVRTRGMVRSITIYAPPKLVKHGYIIISPESIKRLAKIIEEIEATESSEPFELF